MQAGTILTYRLCSRAGQVGAGGVTTDLVKDRSARLLPLTDRDAPDMIGSLRMAPLLAGFRDAPPP
jgi:ATP-grasp domain